MSLSLRERAFGMIPDDFDDMLIKACEYVPPIQVRKKLSPALVIGLCVMLVTATALAVAHSLHIIDLFGVGYVNPEEAKTAVSTEIKQNGGEMGLAIFKVREAFYDGIFLRFIVEGKFSEETVLIEEGWIEWPDSESIASLPGKRLGVKATAVCLSLDQALYLYPPYERGGSWLVGQAFFLEEKQADELDFDLSIDLLDVNDGRLIDHTILSFTIQKTVEVITNEFAVGVQTDLVVVDKAIIARTPFEVVASVEFRPLLRAFNGFTVVPDDGYVVKNGRNYFFGGHFNIPTIKDGKGKIEYVLPVEHAQGNTLTLWVAGTDQAIVIDFHTGESCTKKVITHFEGDNIRVEIEEE